MNTVVYEVVFEYGWRGVASYIRYFGRADKVVGLRNQRSVEGGSNPGRVNIEINFDTDFSVAHTGALNSANTQKH
jgi:hypothetical protein